MAILHENEELTEPAPESILVIEREFDAPRERVWMAWTTPDLVMRWWGPKGYAVPVARISLRVGGSFIICMRSPDGKDIWGTGFYREIVPYERIVSTDSFADEKGNVVSPIVYGMSPDFPRELLLTVTFEEKDGQTKLTLKHAGMPAGKIIGEARQGWTESLDKLASVLAEPPEKT